MSKRTTTIITTDDKDMMTRSLDEALSEGYKLLSFHVRTPIDPAHRLDEVYTALLLSPKPPKHVPEPKRCRECNDMLSNDIDEYMSGICRACYKQGQSGYHSQAPD